MKSLLSSLLIFVGILTTSAQTIPNASFENWYNYPPSGVTMGEYPDSWTTSDSVSVANSGGTSVYDSSDAFDGVKCIHMKSVQVTISGIFTINGPGIATNGLVNLVGTNFVFSGGSPDTARSRFITGEYKYFPTNATDVAVVKAYLFKYNGSTRDTIAKAYVEFGGTVSTYHLFTLPFMYVDYTTQPDTCLIILQSSRGLNDPSIGIGSNFVVDSVGFTGSVGIDELKNAINSVNVFPSPADKELTIDVDLKSNISLSYEIYNLHGQLLRSSLMTSTKEKVDISDLSSGQYILKIGDAKKNVLYSKNISIAR